MSILLEGLFQDVQYAIRQLWKSPGFTVTAVLTLAIGIGANTSGFSIMDAVVLHPLAVPDLKQVVTVYEQQNLGDGQQVALANYEDWRRQSHSFESLAVREPADMSLIGAGDAAHVQTDYTSPSFFTVLRTNAFMGRVFNQTETQPGRNGVAVLSFSFWKSQFASDPAVLGHTIELDQHPYTIIGVMPKTMQYPASADVFLPFAPADAQLANRSGHDFLVLGRLRNGVSMAAAQSELNAIAEHLAQAYPATNQGWHVKLETLLTDINGEYTPLYFNLIQGATLFLLLVVCANVANLQFARGIGRRPEIAMRTAMGAGRGRLLRQLLTENILLGLMGGGFGLLFAQLEMQVSKATMPEVVARHLAGWTNISLNGRALLLSLLLAMGAGVVSGFAPALSALRINLVDQLKAGSRSVLGSGRGRKLRNILAVAQISFAVALVIGAALICKGMYGMLHMADRYNPDQTLVFSVHLPATRYDTPQKKASYYQQSLERLQGLPGVQHAEATSALPYSDNAWVDDFLIENRPLAPGRSQPTMRLTVTPGYFSQFHVGLVSGRTFTAGDNLLTRPVAVVSKSMADRYFPGENPLGRRLRMKTGSVEQTPWLTIVGVVEETTYSLWERARPVAVYADSAQLPQSGLTYAITTSGDPQALGVEVHKALAALDPTLPLDGLESYEKQMHVQLTGMFYVAAMLGFDAFVALLLAAIGIFAVMANLVGERTREIGVRLAMGAQREDVLRMMLRRALWLTGIGIATGLVLAFALAHGVANLLYDVSPNDPVVFPAITATIAAIALLASWFPARRAARIDPMVALREN